MKILIYDNKVVGHHLEYLHHWYSEACLNSNEFFFLVNKDFDQVKDKFHWEKTNNIKFIFLNDEEQKISEGENLLKCAWRMSFVIRKYVKEFQIDRVWLVMFMELMPFLPFFLPKGVLVSGIVYSIYLYNKMKFRGLRLVLENLRYAIISKHFNVERIYILNDSEMTLLLNEKFKSRKFKYLPDPVPDIDKDKLSLIRKVFPINSDDKVYLHFGAMDYRKGTIELLKAINMLPEKIAQNKFFIFAGKVSSNMREEFYEVLKNNKNHSRIKVFDEFCSYEFLNNLCLSCDAIMIPYKSAAQSSGVVGYASFFKKPVIGPAFAMIGKIIKKYSLGLVLDEITPESIKNALCLQLPSVSNEYYEEHNVDSFNRIIFESIDSN